MCRTVLHKADENFCAGDHEDLKFAAMAMLGGGLDTVSVPMQAINFILTGYSDPKQQSRSSILSFFMAMVLYPDVQNKAHAELDAIVGTTRLPYIQDRLKLPYIRSLVAEVLRWAPPAPIGTNFLYI